MRSLVISLFIIALIVGMQSATAQDYRSDPEVKDIRTRVVDVSFEIEIHQYVFDGEPSNETEISFLILMELWNPYDRELVSYGSSSCRWPTQLEVNFSSSLEIENYGEACTEDLSPRNYPSGLSNETSRPSILFLNQSLDNIPDGYILINGMDDGTLDIEIDLFYGVNMTIEDGNISVEHESTPANWGEILYEKQSKLELEVSFLSVIGAVGVVGVFLRQKGKQRI
ncbi:MAG: hypothetical protein ACXADH_16010 [Candidatus Kariarchaeaceae archaeon]|jgi:hypothetical protein